VSGKEIGGRAHPSSGVSVGWHCTVAFDGGGAGTVVTNDATLVLHHGERGRKLRWGPRKARRGAASGSPSVRKAAASREKLRREARALASEADGLILGRMGEVAACLSAGEKERNGGRRLFVAARRRGREAKGGGLVGARPREGGGGLATACTRAGGPGHERVRSGGSSPGTAAPDHAGEAGEEREKGEGGGDRRVGPTRGGAQLTEARERVTDGAGYSADGLK
jgi:hypothetical protein